MVNAEQPNPSPPLRARQPFLPVQAAPIERGPTAATLHAETGVEPALWGTLASIALPIVLDEVRKRL